MQEELDRQILRELQSVRLPADLETLLLDIIACFETAPSRRSPSSIGRSAAVSRALRRR